MPAVAPCRALWRPALAPRRRPIDALVLAGGGVRGVAMLGAVSRLQSAGELDRVRLVVGSSAGALLGALVATRRDLRASLDIMCEHGFSPDCDFGRLFTEYGLDSGRCIDSLVGALLGPSLSFGDVLQRHGIRLVVCVTNLTTRRAEYLGPDTHADMPVALAVRMSCSVPLYFRAVRHQGDWYVDGGVADNFPCAWAAGRADRVFGIRLKPRRGAIKTLDAFLGAVVDASTQEFVPPGVEVLDLDAPGVSSLNFGAPRSQLLALYSAGAAQAALYLKKRA